MKFSSVGKRLMILAIAGAGVLLAVVLLWTAPKTTAQDKKQAARIVQTIRVQPETEKVAVQASGSVIPARRVTMRPQVSGRIVRQHESLVPGGIIEKGEELFAIDADDYHLALDEARAALREARFESRVEEGRRKVAERELEKLRSTLSSDYINEALVLREPQKERAEALIARAENQIAQAELNLKRTSVTAPFNAMVIEENVELGQLADSGSDLCTLVGTDEFWVQASVPISELRWISLPEANNSGSSVRVSLETGGGERVEWEGEIVRLLGDLESTTRLARVLIRVEDPLGLESDAADKPALLLGSYVRVAIDAGELENVIEIPRAALREENRIWLVGPDQKLRIREADIRWRRDTTVLIDNKIRPDEQLVVSDLRSALPGMAVSPQLVEADQADIVEKPLTAR